MPIPNGNEQPGDLSDVEWVAHVDVRKFRLDHPAAPDNEEPEAYDNEEENEPEFDPDTQFWLDQANGSRFLVGEDYHGPNGEPYVVFRLSPDDPAAVPFRQIALALYDRDCGALLCHGDWSADGDDDDLLLVYFGDVVDVLMVGELKARSPWTHGWGFPADFPGGYKGASVSDPGMLTLPLGPRRSIQWLLSQVGVVEPKVSLLAAREGQRTLVFNALDGGLTEDEDRRLLEWRILWCLPRYYAARLLPDDGTARYPLLPVDGEPLVPATAPAIDVEDEDALPEYPRPGHYYFSHRYLRENVEGDPGFTIDHLRSDTATIYLRTLWMTCGAAFMSEEDGLIEAASIDVFPIDFNGGWTGVIIQFPPPIRQAEAYYAAAVFKGEHSEGQAEPTEYRYITLELGGRPGQTALGEWHGGIHLHNGAGPSPDLRSFAKAVVGLLSEGDAGIGTADEDDAAAEANTPMAGNTHKGSWDDDPDQQDGEYLMTFGPLRGTPTQKPGDYTPPANLKSTGAYADLARTIPPKDHSQESQSSGADQDDLSRRLNEALRDDKMDEATEILMQMHGLTDD